MDKQILVTRSSMPDYEEYCKEIKKFWDSHWITNMGIEHKALRRKLEDFCIARMWCCIPMVIWLWKM